MAYFLRCQRNNPNRQKIITTPNAAPMPIPAFALGERVAGVEAIDATGMLEEVIDCELPDVVAVAIFGWSVKVDATVVTVTTHLLSSCYEFSYR